MKSTRMISDNVTQWEVLPTDCATAETRFAKTWTGRRLLKDRSAAVLFGRTDLNLPAVSRDQGSGPRRG